MSSWEGINLLFEYGRWMMKENKTRNSLDIWDRRLTTGKGNFSMIRKDCSINLFEHHFMASLELDHVYYRYSRK